MSEKVFCIRCIYVDKGSTCIEKKIRCLYPDNTYEKNKDNWYRKGWERFDVKQYPKEINKSNNCEWYKKKLRYYED